MTGSGSSAAANDRVRWVVREGSDTTHMAHRAFSPLAFEQVDAVPAKREGKRLVYLLAVLVEKVEEEDCEDKRKSSSKSTLKHYAQKPGP